jgi:prephenate dehydratase
MNSKVAAAEILKQLGGGRFIAMTGAKQFVALDKPGMVFKLPSNFASQGINMIKIVLDPSDTYSLYFYKSRGASLKELEVRQMVYCDQLQAVFTEVTGLHTSL